MDQDPESYGLREQSPAPCPAPLIYSSLLKKRNAEGCAYDLLHFFKEISSAHPIWIANQNWKLIIEAAREVIILFFLTTPSKSNSPFLTQIMKERSNGDILADALKDIYSANPTS